MASKEELFDVDPNRLDRELREYPYLFHNAGIELATARFDYERAKASLEVTESELDRNIRRDPAQFGLEKITEPAVEKVIVLQRRYTIDRDAVIKAKHMMDVCQVRLDTIAAKGKSIELLCKLHGMEYFSGEIRLPREDREQTRQRETKDVFDKRK